MLLWQSAMCNNKCDKVWEEWQSVRWKRSLSPRKWAKFQTPHWMQGYGRFSRRPLFASLAAVLSYSSILPRTSRVSDYLLSLCLRFCFHISLLALSSSLSSQFCTMKPLVPPQRLEQQSVHTFCKQELLISFLNGTDTLACIPKAWQIAFLKRDGSWGHTLPTENTHCKISSLALRRSATSIN